MTGIKFRVFVSVPVLSAMNLSSEKKEPCYATVVDH